MKRNPENKASLKESKTTEEKLWAAEMTEQIKVFATRPDDLSSLEKEKMCLHKLFFDLQTCSIAHTSPLAKHTPIQNK